MSNICIIGTGYVGLITGVCFADLGNTVHCLDINEERIKQLQQGVMPIYEPGLEEIVERNVSVDGEADLNYVHSAAEDVARSVNHKIILVNKSTVPVGTGDSITETIQKSHGEKELNFSVVSNPEFLREGSAISDFMNPDRIVLGSTNPEAAREVAKLYQPLRAPVMITDLRTAEMIKYASNAFLATRISFINEIANICDELGADVREVADGMGMDKRIGRSFLDAGLGWGGSCFPKDVKALAHMAVLHNTHPQLLQAVMDINRNQRRRVVYKLRKVLGGSLADKEVGILGLSFKPNTDDMREAPAVEIIHLLENEGAKVRAYDPQAMENAKIELPHIQLCKDPYQAAENADALVLATEWNEFKQLDFKKLFRLMRTPVLVDGRNQWDSKKMREIGFTYFGIGQGNHIENNTN